MLFFSFRILVISKIIYYLFMFIFCRIIFSYELYKFTKVEVTKQLIIKKNTLKSFWHESYFKPL